MLIGFLTGVELVDLRGMRSILRSRPVEFLVALITALTILFVGVEQGVLLAILISIIAHLRHGYRPYDRLLSPTPAGDWDNGPLETGAQAAPGLLVYRFGASLYYANASRFGFEVRELLRRPLSPVRWFCLDAGNVQDVDFSGSAVLRAVVSELHGHRVTFVVSDAPEPVMAELERDGQLDLIGREHVFDSLKTMIAAYRALPPQLPDAPGDTTSAAAD